MLSRPHPSSSKPATVCSASENDAASASAEASSSAPPNSNTKDLPSGDMVYEAPGGFRKFLTSLALTRALPWRKFKKGSMLVIEIGGDIGEQQSGRFGSPLNLPTLADALVKAAVDPRVEGIYFKISPLGAGWSKLEEVRRLIAYFRQSGKWTTAYMSLGGEKEYFLASACGEVFVAPTANLTLKGFKVAGTFLRGVLDKIGVTPELVRIGKYKSAGDQLLRTDMSDPQREQLKALLDTIYEGFSTTVATARGKTIDEVTEMLDQGFYDQKDYLNGGWVDGLLYQDEVEDKLFERVGMKKDKKTGLWKGAPKTVSLNKYAKVGKSAFGLGGGKKQVAIIRCGGAILSGGGQSGGGQIKADDIIRKLRSVEKRKDVAAVVLRVDSPGGDALASDLMWHAIKRLRKTKPVVASFGDVSASGGYYMGMACSAIVAEALTITGSIGVISGKFNLANFYEKIGYVKESIARGRWSELTSDEKPFTAEEKQYFEEQAQFAYRSFRDKAAESRGMSIDDMQERAQGRVWSGKDALGQGLIDAIGGVSRAVAIAKRAAKLDDKDKVRVIELSSESVSPLQLLTGAGASASSSPTAAARLLGLTQLLGMAVTQPQAALAFVAMAMTNAGSGGSTVNTAGLDLNRPLAMMPSYQADGAHSAALLRAGTTAGLPEDLLSLLL